MSFGSAVLAITSIERANLSCINSWILILLIWTFFQVEPRDNKENGQSHDLRNTLKVPIRLKTFVELAMDVASASPRRYFFEVRQWSVWISCLSNSNIRWHGIFDIFCCCLYYLPVLHWCMLCSSSLFCLCSSTLCMITTYQSNLISHLDRSFLQVMSYFATAEHEKERLQYFASPEGRDDLYEYNQKERRTVLEVMKIFPLFV